MIIAALTTCCMLFDSLFEPGLDVVSYAE